MALPFGVSVGDITLASIGLIVFGALVREGVKWWLRRREKRREAVQKWHRETIDLFNQVQSVGRRLNIGRVVDVDVIEEELVPVTVDLQSKAKSPPPDVQRSVNPDVLETVAGAAGAAYHLAHITTPDRNEDSIAGVIRHQYEMLQDLGTDTNVAMGDVLDVIGELNQPTDLAVTEEEAQQILDDFEAEAEKQVDDFDDMTVDEFMELPWETVDEVLSKDARQAIIEFSIDEFHEIALQETPREAKKMLRTSEQDLFA